jgi:hypothetical protein
VNQTTNSTKAKRKKGKKTNNDPQNTTSEEIEQHEPHKKPRMVSLNFVESFMNLLYQSSIIKE